MIVSKDDDSSQRSFLEGAPPKVVSLQVGNAGTRKIVELRRRKANRLRKFDAEEESALLILRDAVQRIGVQRLAALSPGASRTPRTLAILPRPTTAQREDGRCNGLLFGRNEN